MVRLIEDKRRELEGLCRRYHVRVLEVFGSAALDDFEGEPGDILTLLNFLSTES